MKKTFLALALMVLPMLANAEGVEIDGICYNLISKAKQAEVTSKSANYFGEVVIPQSLEYNGDTYRVTSIGSYAFYYCNQLTSVTIPNSVVSIGSCAFGHCI